MHKNHKPKKIFACKTIWPKTYGHRKEKKFRPWPKKKVTANFQKSRPFLKKNSAMPKKKLRPCFCIKNFFLIKVLSIFQKNKIFICLKLYFKEIEKRESIYDRSQKALIPYVETSMIRSLVD